jgi:hypothetical protein
MYMKWRKAQPKTAYDDVGMSSSFLIDLVKNTSLFAVTFSLNLHRKQVKNI